MLPEPARWKRALREALAEVAGVRPSSGAEMFSPRKTLEFPALLPGWTSLRPRTGALRRSFAIGARSAGILPAGFGGIPAASFGASLKMSLVRSSHANGSIHRP